MIGIAVGDFAWLAYGRADGVVMYSTYPWNVEAGGLLVAEAGGIVTRVLLSNGESAYIGERFSAPELSGTGHNGETPLTYVRHRPILAHMIRLSRTYVHTAALT